MTIRILAPLKSVLLVGTACMSLQYSVTTTRAGALDAGIILAQAGQERQESEGNRERKGKPDGAPDRPAKRDEAKDSAPATRAPNVQQQQKPAAQQQERRDERRDQRREAQPERPPQPPATAKPQLQPTPPASQDGRSPPQQAPTAQQPQRPESPATQDRRDQRRDADRERRPGAPQQAPTAQQPAQQPQPSTAQPQQPAGQQAPAAQLGAQQLPAPAQSPASLAPPTKARDAREFIRRGGDAPVRGMDQIRRERREVREGDRTVIREQDRAIIREGGRTIIRHNEANRFAVGARDVRVERRGGTIETVIERGGGVRIVTVTDPDGRLIRRVRRDARGRDVVLIDNSFAGPRMSLFVQLPLPVIGIPRERYIVEMGRARREDIYEVFLAPPVQRLERRYTLDQVRYNPPLRAYMPRVDLDINFDTGSWQITPDQIGKLEVIARGIMRAIERDPREVFLIEGHTDAIGSDEDNLSLSDRRAESVAIALTEEFEVPPENLVTQGFGEQELKIQTDGPSRENRRVAVRRITPLIDDRVAGAGRR